MQRVLPYVVLVIFVVALVVAIFPLPRPGGEPGDTLETRFGLDLIGGLRGEYQVVATDDQPVTQEILEQTRVIIENRVNASGVAEPIVVTQGQDRISVELPGVEEEGDIRRLIGTTGILEFIIVPPAFFGQPAQGAPLPPGMADTEPLFTGVEIENARIGQDQTTGEIVVNLELKETGARLFDEHADAVFGGLPDDDQFAIVLDGIVTSAPTINAPRFGGNAQISGGQGGFPADEAQSLVTVLKFGSLPLEIREVGFSSISATLGLDFLTQTVAAGIVGILLVFTFMLLYYRVPGVVACIALVFYSIFVYAIFRLFGVTLTLAGIAAFILSVGMAVDANILIFERTKEELRAGKNLTAAVEAGFARAWNSILDSNVSTLITCTILYWFAFNIIRAIIAYYPVVLLEEDPGFQTTLMAALFGTAVVVFLLLPTLSKRFTNKQLMLTGMLSFAVLMTFTAFVDRFGDLKSVVAMIHMALMGFPVAVLLVIPNAAISDLSELDGYKTGKNREAMFFGTQGLFMKVNYGIASAITASLFAFFGKDIAAPLGVKLAGPVGGLFVLAGFFVFLRFPQKKVTEELTRYRSGAGA